MIARLAALAALALSAGPFAVFAQSSSMPLYPGAPPRTYEQRPLPPMTPIPDSAGAATGIPPETRPPLTMPRAVDPAMGPTVMAPGATSQPPATAGTPAERVFCAQAVPVRVTENDGVPERYRPFVGIWSDASWTPQVCAALVVENVTPDGTATIVYAFGPMGPNTRTAGGVLRGTGLIRDGELRFQNSDGSQYVFRPAYSDLDGRLTTPQGQTYSAIFKKAL
jgi:hypothetical protein